VPKAVYRSSCRDKHNCQRRDSKLDPLTPQSDALTTRLLRPVDDKFEPIKDKICSYYCTPIVITEDDVLKRLNKLNVNKSEGPSLIHPRVMYEIIHEIARLLAMLFNRSLESNQIPTIWKCANISPIYKKGRKDKVNNYRPVSLTCILCKVMESIVRDKVVAHFVKNKLFTNKQFGFLKGRSTVTQLLQIFGRLDRNIGIK